MLLRILFLLILGTGFLSAQQPAPATPPAKPAKPAKPEFHPVLPPGTQVKQDIPYVDNGGPDQTLDLYLPEKSDAKLPVIVWIHGGAWRSGDNRGWCPAYGMLAKGYAIANIRYRLSVKDAPWPAQIYDCKAAVRWLRAHAAEYNFDPDHIGAWGHSAGGHLSAMLGVTNNNPEFEGDEGNLQYSSAVQAVCDWSGPTELVAYFHAPGPYGQAMIAQLLGGKDPTVATDEKATAASPLTYVSAKTVPFMIAQGAKDPVVTPSDAQKLDAALKAAGVETTLIMVPEGTHGIGGPDLEKQAGDFFDRHLKSGTAPAQNPPAAAPSTQQPST